jgi:hypothetical protein
MSRIDRPLPLSDTAVFSEWVLKRERVLDCEPASLSPSKLKSAADKQVKSKSQQQWAFGSVIIDILSAECVGQKGLGSEGRISIEIREQEVDLIPASILEL